MGQLTGREEAALLAQLAAVLEHSRDRLQACLRLTAAVAAADTSRGGVSAAAGGPDAAGPAAPPISQAG